MKNINNIKNAAIIFLLVLLCAYVWNGCKKDREMKDMLSQLSKYELSNQQFKMKRNADSSTIVQQQQTLLTQKEAIELGLVKLEGQIVKLQAQVNIKQEIKYVNVKAPFIPENFTDTSGWYLKFKNGDSSKAVIDSFIANSIVVPKSFRVNDEWLKMDGKVKKDGVVVDSMTIPNKTSVSIGWKRSGFLKLFKVPVVEVKNTNPKLSVVEMSNVVIEKKKGFFQKPLVWAGIGLVGGYILKSKL